MLTDPSGVGNASKVAPIAPPRISVPTIPQFKWCKEELRLD
jgi:hypothetical protein